jgi:hypothetical protein
MPVHRTFKLTVQSLIRLFYAVQRYSTKIPPLSLWSIRYICFYSTPSPPRPSHPVVSLSALSAVGYCRDFAQQCFISKSLLASGRSIRYR